MLHGSCLCGLVRYEIDGEIGPLANCHCQTCRKAHAAAFATVASVPRSRFRWTAGASSVAAFESSPGKERFFCPRCGSQLIAAWRDRPTVIVRVGSLDDDPGTRPRVHIWASEKAAWHDIADALPRLAEGLRAGS